MLIIVGFVVDTVVVSWVTVVVFGVVTVVVETVVVLAGASDPVR